MGKYHKIISITIALLYVVVVQIFSYPQPVFRFLLPVFLIFVGLTSLYNYYFLKSLAKFNFWIALRPVLVFAGVFGLFFIVPSEFLRSLVLILSVAAIFLSEVFLDNFSEAVLMNETIAILFGLLLTLSAFSQFYPGYKVLNMFGVFALVTLTARCFLEFVPVGKKEKFLSSLVLGFFSAQFFWALSLLPFHFSVGGLMLFNLTYFFLVTDYLHIFKSLSFKRLQFHLLLLFVATGIAVVSTPWRII